MSHPYCGKRRYILFTIHISLYIKYWYVMLCLIQTLNLFNTYLHLILDVQLYTRVATTVYPVWMGLAREQTGGQSDSWDTGHFLTLLHSASCLKTQCHTMKLYFFLTDISLHWLWLTQLFQKVDRQVEQSIWTLYFPCKNHSLNDWHIKLQV